MRGSVLLLNQRQWKRGFRPQGRARAGLGGDSRSSPGARCSWRRSWAQLRVTLTATESSLSSPALSPSPCSDGLKAKLIKKSPPTHRQGVLCPRKGQGRFSRKVSYISIYFSLQLTAVLSLGPPHL